MVTRSSWQFAARLKSGPVLVFWLFVFLLFLAGGSTPVAAAQRLPQVPDATAGRPTLPGVGDPRDAHDPFSEQTASKMTHLREDERRKRLVTDMAKLVALSNELKTEVDNTTRDELSLDVIRKATEIEKLAHDVRERMKN